MDRMPFVIPTTVGEPNVSGGTLLSEPTYEVLSLRQHPVRIGEKYEHGMTPPTHLDELYGRSTPLSE